MATVANVYAKAIYEVSLEKKQLDQLFQDLKNVNEAYLENKALAAVLEGAGIDTSQRLLVLKEFLKAINASPLASKFLELIVSRGRIKALPGIVSELNRLIEASQGIISGEVRAATDLSAEELKVLAEAIGRKVNSKVKLTQSVDASLLGGMVATVGGKTFDASLRTQLDKFKNDLL